MTGAPIRDPLNACHGKQSLPTYRDAIRAARRQRDRNGSTANVYHCQHCNGYHIGNRPQGSKPSQRKGISKARAKSALELYKPSADDIHNSQE